MIPFLLRTIFLFLFISGKLIFPQVRAYLPDTDQLDSSDVSQNLLDQDFDDTRFYIFKNLIHTNFIGFADVAKFSNDYQVFDFAFIGRPQYLSAPNMLPHQLKFSLNNEILNQSANGMFNTRFLSADQINLLTGSDPTFTAYQYTSMVEPLEKNETEPYTRVKFFEGDNRYTDLDIYFVRDISDNMQLKLAGFNKGYGGTGYNNFHTGVMYDTQLKIKMSKNITSEIFWNRNHERSGMRPFDPGLKTLDHKYYMDAGRAGIRFYFNQDSINNNQIETGFTSVVNRHRNFKKGTFSARQNSDDYKFYVSKNFNTKKNLFTALFSINQQYIWGNTFSDNFSQTLLSLNLFDRYDISPVSYFEGGFELQSLSDYNPIINSSLSWNYQAQSNLYSKMEVNISHRYPNPVESSIAYNSYSGNTNLEAEEMLGYSALQRWQILDFLLLQGEVGYNLIKNEIGLIDSSFINTKDRDWFYFKGESHLKIWKFILSSGGRAFSADQYLSPKKSLWGKLIFHGELFNGTIVVDASTNVRWYSRHDQVLFEQGLNRFYKGKGESASYSVYGFKLVGTVDDAEIFFEMDNFLENTHEFVKGYFLSSRVVRFGVNWIMWD